MSTEFIIAAIVTIVGLTTPILLAALGELVVEKAGVLNLGVEGMMLMGAICGFGATVSTFNPWLGILVQPRVARCRPCSLQSLFWS